jgi:transposase-like protein
MTATLRYASRKYWDQLARDLKAIYTAPTEQAAWASFEELEEKWGKPYPAIPKLWRAAWQEFIPFLAYGACREITCPGSDRWGAKPGGCAAGGRIAA